MPTTLDHLMVALFAVAWPCYVLFVEMPRFRRRQAAGEPVRLIRDYLQTIALQWSLAVLALIVWSASGRPLADLGFRLPRGWHLWIGGGLVVAAIVGLWLQLAMVRAQATARELLRRQVAPLAFLLPTRPTELRVFYAVAVTAGLCEELLFRGYLIWYLDLLIGLPAAIGVSSLLFGLGHAYQGRDGAMRAGLTGLAMAALYLPTRSLLLPVVAHAMIDALGGRTAYEALREEQPAAAA